MTIAPALRKIERALLDIVAEPTLDRDAILIAAKRIGAQAEMIELDIDKIEGLS